MSVQLKEIKVPEVFSRGNVAEMFAQAGLGSTEIQTFADEVGRILRSDEVNQLISSGNLTLAMIKPDLRESVDRSKLTDPELDDASLADLIEKSIEPPLSVSFSLSLTMTKEMVEAWYGGVGGPMEVMLKMDPLNPERYGGVHQNRWEEFSALMTRGPVTFLLITEESGNAVAAWRNQMGNDWNITRVKQTYPESLRARYGVDPHNNLLHGSDSPESVRREIDFVIDALTAMAKSEPN